MAPPYLPSAIILIVCCLLPEIISYSFLPTASHRTVLSQQFRTGAADPSHRRTHPTTRTQTPDRPRHLTMKVSRGRSKDNKSNSLVTINRTRVQLAGKPGTKHYLDPSKVFVGNLPYDATVDDLTGFVKEHLSSLHTVFSIKIVTDWRTGKSKGFGFVQFMDPISATSAMSIVRGKKLKGRVIRLDQGRKKDDLEDRKLFVKKRSRDKGGLDEEARVIDGVLDRVDGIEGDLAAETGGGQTAEEDVYTLEDFDDEDDALFDDDDDEDDDEDDEFDGIFEQIYGPNKWEDLDEEETKNMNRAQKREAAKRRPRKKLPHKGFEAVPTRKK